MEERKQGGVEWFSQEQVVTKIKMENKGLLMVHAAQLLPHKKKVHEFHKKSLLNEFLPHYGVSRAENYVSALSLRGMLFHV